VQIENKRDRIFRSDNWTKRDKNRERESEECVELADAKVCQGYTKILGVGELLSLIHQRLCIYSQAFAQPGEKGSEVGLDREAGRSI